MAWQDSLREASFRGVRFHVEAVEGEVGRRTVVHEFPGREESHVEDLGKLARRFSIEAFVIGVNYHQQRDRLLDAFETPGPGELVHPYWGEHRVVPTGAVRFRESTDEGGYCAITFTCTRTGDPKAPFESIDTAETVGAAADDAIAAAEAEFTDGFSVSGQPQWILDKATKDLDKATEALRRMNGRVDSSLVKLHSAANEVDALASETAQLVLTPSKLATAVTRMVASVVGGVGLVESAAASTLRLLLSDADDIGDVDAIPSTVSAFSRNGILSRMLTKTAHVAEASRVAAEIEYDSADAASQIRDALFDAIDALLPYVGTALYETLVDLQASVSRHLDTTAARLPTVTTYTTFDEVPALVLAYEIYGDPDRDAEILARNGLSDPTAIPGQTTLQVLSE